MSGGTLVLSALETLIGGGDLTISNGTTVSLMAHDNAIWNPNGKVGALTINGGTLSSDATDTNEHTLGKVYLNGNATIT